MISKLAKAHESWVFKLISAAVAVSFVSLFGVTGYINSASQNQTVIKVGHKKITQSEFSYRLQKELSALKKLTNDDLEISDELRNSIIENVILQLTNESVLEQLMDKYNIRFPRILVQQAIASQPQFKNPLNGQFHPELFKRYLSAAHMTEEEYVTATERALARKMLVSDLVENFNSPIALVKAIHKMDNQRKTFKYITISPEEVAIERKISDDEIKQYYEDFAENFMVPEARNADVLFVPNDFILNKYAASPEMIEDYFKQHQKEFDEPEKREIAQMVFMDKETADKALIEVKAGKSFTETAKTFKAENADEPTLGLVAQDELAEDLADAAFGMAVNAPEVLQVADTWQVININKINAAKKADFDSAKAQIKELLSTDNFYEAMREVRADIDDAVNGGKSLEEVADTLGFSLVQVTNIQEETLVENAPEALKSLMSSLDFNEVAFSYGLDEISSAEEFDEGIAVLKITAIKEPHLPEIEVIKDRIVELWTVQEKDALAKEIADNIMTDATDGSQLTEAAKARGLEIFRSEPISRTERFANLTPYEINDLFLAGDNEVKLFEHAGNHFIIAAPVETVNYADELTEDKFKELATRAANSLVSDMSQNALNNYAKEFNIKVDYKLAGFSE